LKDILKDINKAFENKTRLGIMSALVVNDYMDFNSLKQLLDVTDGNLASHIKHLEKREYVIFEKEFVAKKPKTKYKITVMGKQAFVKHIRAIEKLLR